MFGNLSMKTLLLISISMYTGHYFAMPFYQRIWMMLWSLSCYQSNVHVDEVRISYCNTTVIVIVLYCYYLLCQCRFRLNSGLWYTRTSRTFSLTKSWRRWSRHLYSAPKRSTARRRERRGLRSSTTRLLDKSQNLNNISSFVLLKKLSIVGLCVIVDS